MTQQNLSAFDYSVTLSRRYRYLMISCPEFGVELTAEFLDLAQLRPEELGACVIRVFGRIAARLHQLRNRGERLPTPLSLRRVFSVKQAAQLLDMSPTEIRRLAREQLLESRKTPGGHFRFTLESLSRFLVKEEARAPEPIRQVA